MTAASANWETRWDAVIIGGGIGGLSAAAYLARAGKRTLVLESHSAFSGRAENGSLGKNIFAPVAAEGFYAVDRALIHDLRLHQFGLRFAQRAMPMIALRIDGRHLTLPHEIYAMRAAIRNLSAADASAYPRYRRELFALARRLRSMWAPLGNGEKQVQAMHRPAFPGQVPLGGAGAVGEALELSRAEIDRLDWIAHSSANAFLHNWFENDTLKTALAFDTTLDGVAPDEPSSALLLAWRAAQECSGLQGAVGQVEGGPVALADAIADAARAEGAILRHGTSVSRIEASDGRVFGVRLDDGEFLETNLVISSLCARQTYEELLLPEARPFGTLRQSSRPVHFSSAKGHFSLKGLPPFAGLSPRDLRGRMIVSEHPEAATESKVAALTGALPNDLVMEVTVPTIADPTLSTEGVHILSVRVPFLPVTPEGGWAANEDVLKKRILSDLERYAPGLKERIISGFVITPDDFRARYGADDSQRNFLERLMGSYEARVRGPLEGLYLCGVDTEAVGALTGRAGRVAASLALAETTNLGVQDDE